MRRHVAKFGLVALALGLVFTRTDILAQGGGLVRITPLGSHTGELCVFDRALLIEDPTGIRILYDPGRTVDDNDPVVLSLGDVTRSFDGEGRCVGCR